MPGLYGEQARFDVVDVGGEIGDQLGPVVETDDEELILRIGGAQKFQNRVSGTVDLVGHTAAQIKDDPNRDRRILGREALELLQSIVFVDEKVLLLQAGNQAIKWVGDGNRHQHQVYVDPHALVGPCAQRLFPLQNWRQLPSFL